MKRKFELFNCSPSEAQKQCNFVVFSPQFLPPDLNISEQHLRPESKFEENRGENNRSTFRQVFKGTNRTLTMKQFLYDWAPPAYDYPCLWRNDKVATTAESPAPTGEFVNNNVLWFGKNYRQQEAATIEIERTRIEITFEKGAFSNKEIISLCKSLVPVDKKTAKQLLILPFSELSFSHRYEVSAVSVPVGYWKHSRSEELICYSLNKSEIADRIIKILQPIIISLKDRNYILTGGFGFGKNKADMEETELLFEHQNAPGCFIRLLCTPVSSPFSIFVPPALSDQECIEKNLSIGEQDFYYATSKNCAFGSHEIVFNREFFNYMMLIKPTPWTTFEWVKELLRVSFM